MQLILSISLSPSLSLSPPMAATKKGRKSKRSSFLCSFKACFGISNKVSSDHGDRKSLTGRGKGSFPVNDQFIPAKSSEIVPSSKEIHIVEGDEEKKNQSADELIMSDNKTSDITSDKSKNKGESSPKITTAHDTWTNHRKLSHSVSLPALNPKREKPAAAAAAGGEFDSTVGAVIVSVTLVVMIIWGKFCAILCTAAWFYLVPRIRAKLDESYAVKFNNGENDAVDYGSWEYKKKVVLQGLLHRNQTL